MQTKGDIAAWLRLQLTPGIGNASMRRLLAAFSLPQNIFQQDYAALSHVVSAKQAQALLQYPAGFEQALEQLLAWLQLSGQSLICLGDAAYPQSLLHSPDPPWLLYVQCADEAWWQNWAEQEQAPLLGIIGSRKPTPHGLSIARDWAQELAQRGCSIVSGLALGIDAAAHQGALAAPPWRSGRTLAVVGTGLDQVYPRQHAALAQNILDAGGAIISEYPLGTAAIAANFPKRNRIIAGLSLGVLVVEAALQSGSLISARLAMEANREVFAIPGSIAALQYQGCHALIKQGAQLVESVEDVWAGLSLNVTKHQFNQTNAIKKEAVQAAFMGKFEENPIKKPSPLKPPSIGQDLWEKMGFTPQSLDILALQTGQSAADLQVQLLSLEMAGLVQRLDGGLYQRIA